MSQLDRLPHEGEWKEWLEHPTTLAVHRLLRQWKAEAQGAWAAGRFQLDGDPVQTTNMNAKVLGNLGTIEAVLDMTYESLVGELSEE